MLPLVLRLWFISKALSRGVRLCRSWAGIECCWGSGWVGRSIWLISPRGDDLLFLLVLILAVRKLLHGARATIPVRWHYRSFFLITPPFNNRTLETPRTRSCPIRSSSYRNRRRKCCTSSRKTRRDRKKRRRRSKTLATAQPIGREGTRRNNTRPPSRNRTRLLTLACCRMRDGAVGLEPTVWGGRLLYRACAALAAAVAALAAAVAGCCRRRRRGICGCFWPESSECDYCFCLRPSLLLVEFLALAKRCVDCGTAMHRCWKRGRLFWVWRRLFLGAKRGPAIFV